MKNIFKRIGLVFAVMCLLCSTSPYVALYNDQKFDDYENMRDKGGIIKYTVPNLFKDDTPFKNVKRFPLVVQNSVEYVPLEMFFGLSGISVNTDLSFGDFYINNSQNEKFISFDVSEDIATSHLNRPFTLQTKVFYSTRYVPVRSVCDLLGISYDVYDDKENKVFAVRITTGDAKIEMNELIKMYSPVKIENNGPLPEPQLPDEQENVENKDNTEIPEQIPDIPVIPEISDNENSKNIRFLFMDALSGNTNEIITLLNSYGYKATFFCTEQSIIENADIVRSLYVSGHSVGMYLKGSDGEIEQSIKNTNEALNFVCKKTTRLCATDGSFDPEKEEYQLEMYGIDKYSYNLWAGGKNTKSVFEKLKANISELDKKQYTRIASIGMYCNSNTVSLLKQLLPYIKSKSMYSVSAIY